MTKKVVLGICSVVGVVELLLFANYRAHEASVHFFLHGLAGINVALLVFILFRQLLKRQLSYFILWVFGLHQFAMLPDYAYQAGYPHQPWMNIFLGHVFLDNLRYHEWFLGSLLIVLSLIYLTISKKTAIK